ncbi:MAG: TRAP transporter small permease [Rhodobacteraceae bacterium]|nr:TRAP transporter small permease [Paracoccaceae bacterium]
MNRVLKVWNATENAIIGLLLIIALLMSLYDMFGRIIDPKLVTGYSEEVVVYIIVWALFIAASKLTQEGRHVRADLIIQMLPLSGRRMAELFHCFVGLTFSGILFYYSYLAAFEAWDFGDLSAGTLRMPLWIFYAGLPVGFGLVVLRYLIKIWALCFQFTPALLDHHAAES